jgi:RNA-directed DNA polymerase
MPALIKALNQTLRGWGNYHRHVVASDAFSRIDTYVYEQLWRTLRRRHPRQSKKWLTRHYWSGGGGRNVFSYGGKLKQGPRRYEVIRLCSIGIQQIQEDQVRSQSV